MSRYITKEILYKGLGYTIILDNEAEIAVGDRFYDSSLDCIAWRTETGLMHKDDIKVIGSFPALPEPLEKISIDSIIETIAETEFLSVGDDGLFPNHTDKDIWVSGFKAGLLYNKKNI